MTDRFLNLQGTFNTRDIGGYTTRDGKALRYGRFFRSDSLHNLSDADRTLIYDTGIRTVIDLRRADEIAADPNKVNGIRDLLTFELPILPNAVSNPSPDNPLKAVRSMGDVYLAVLEHFREPLKAVFETIADRSEAGVLVHCSAGKDRTGVVIALLMSLVDVPDETIITDYMITQERLTGILERLRQRALTAGLDMARHEQMLNIAPEYMKGMLDHLHKSYGTAADYFTAIGVSEARLNRLRAALIAE